jgi:hypothetical protein
MKDVRMDISWRLVQLFLGDEGISEVSVAVHDNRKVRCSCAVFNSAGRCKHTKFVRAKILKNEGSYVVEVITKNIAEEFELTALDNEDSWRTFVYTHGKVEVID